MGKKPAFPKVNLKYPTLEAFAKAARKSFGQGRLPVRLKKQFDSGQRLVLIFQFGDREAPVEIIGQVMDRIEDKQKGGFAYGIRFLNFTENKLNRLLAGGELKPKEPFPQPAAPPPAPPKLAAKAEKPVAAPAKPAPGPAPKVEKPRPAVEEKAEKPAVEVSRPEEGFEEEILLRKGGTQTFDGRPFEEPRETGQPEIKPAPAASGKAPEAAPEIPGSPAESESPAVTMKPVAAEPEAGGPSLQKPAPAPAEPAPVFKFEEAAFTEEPAKTSAPQPVEVEKSVILGEGVVIRQKAPAPTVEEPTPEVAAKSASKSTPPTGQQFALFEEAMPAGAVVEKAPEKKASAPAQPEAPLFEELPLLATPAAKPAPGGEAVAEAAAPAEDDLDFGALSPIPELLKEAKPLPKVAESAGVKPAGAEGKFFEEAAPFLETGPGSGAAAAVAGVAESAEELAEPGEELPELFEEAPEAAGEAELPKAAAAEAPVEFKPLPPEQLSDFLFRFCRIVLNPPAPDQTDSDKQFSTLFEDFQKLMESRDRIGIYLVLAGSGKDFIVEGAQQNPRSIKVLLPPEMAGTLIFRLIDLFDAKELVGISFRKYLNPEHFQNCIMSLARFHPEKESADELASGLIKAGIYHFRPIFETDLVAVPEKIKEDTEIILARLSSELKRLKTMSEQMSEEPLALLTLRLEDILRPGTDHEVVAQTLEHLPLIWTGAISEFEFQDLEDQILFSIPAPVLIKSAELLVKKLISSKGSKGKGPGAPEKSRANLERLLRRVMARIAYEAPDQAMQGLGELFDRELIKYEELPEDIRDQVAAPRLASDFLKTPEPKMAQLAQAAAPGAYSKLASQLIWTAIALLDKKQFSWAQKIFSTLVGHYRDQNPPFPDRPRLARESLKRLSEPFAIELLTRALASGKKEERELAAGMLYATGSAAVKKLLVILEQSADRNVRRLACEILARVGQGAVPTLAEKINTPGIPWYLTRNLLMILAEIKSEVLRDKLPSYLKHPHPRVREEAIGYMLAIGEEQTEMILASLLKDPETSVRRRALAGMSKLEKLAPDTLLGIANLIKELAAAEPSPAAELTFQQALDLASRHGSEKSAGGATLNESLLDLLEQSEAHGIFSRAKLTLSPKMKIALIEALGKGRVGDARKLLTKLAKDKDEQIKKSAEKALELIGK